MAMPYYFRWQIKTKFLLFLSKYDNPENVDDYNKENGGNSK